MSEETIDNVRRVLAWHRDTCRACVSDGETGIENEQGLDIESTQVPESDPETARDGSW